MPAGWHRLALVAALVAAVETVGGYLHWWWSVAAAGLRGPDFFSFYAAARVFLTRGGGAVYDPAAQQAQQDLVTGTWHEGPHVLLPYIHPPYYTLLIAPLGLLSYPAAYAVMAAANLLLLGSAVGLIGATLELSPRGRAVLGVFAVAFLPVFVCLLQGQSDVVMLAALAASAWRWKRGDEVGAGVFAGLALIKPQLLLLIPVAFFVARAWRALAALAATGAALALVSLLAFGLQGLSHYAAVVLPWLGGGTPAFPIAGQSVYSLRGLLEQSTGSHTAALVGLTILYVGACGLLWAGRRTDPAALLAAAVAMGIALSPYQNLHDLTLLVLPGAVLARAGGPLPWLVGAAVVTVDVSLLVGTLAALAAVLLLSLLAVVALLLPQTLTKSRLRQAR